MIVLKTIAMSFVFLLCLGTGLHGQCGTMLRARSTVLATNYHVANVATYVPSCVPAYVAPTVIQYVPLHGLQYQATSLESLAILDQLKKGNDLNERLLQVLAKSINQKAGIPDEPAFVSILRNNCASCHSAPGAKGKFTMFVNGQLANLSQVQFENIIDRVSADDPQIAMPPNKRMSQRDSSQLVIGIVQKFQVQSKDESKQPDLPGKPLKEKS